MKVAVIGIGGVGGYFGGRLCQLLNCQSDLEIHFIARGQHLPEIQKNGLRLDTDEGEMTCRPTSATDAFADLPELDFVMIGVKSYDLDSILTRLEEKITEKTTILPLLNGVDIYERIRRKIKTGVVFPACVYIGAQIERPGKVTQRGGLCTIIFGKDPAKDRIDERIFELFTQAGIKHQWHEDPFAEIWSKFIFVAPFSLVTARFDKTIGELLASQKLSSVVKNIMREIESVARKKGIALPENIAETSFEKARGFPFESKTSFQRDYENTNKPDERDIFGGAIIRMAEQLGIAVHTTQEIYQSLQTKKRQKARL